MVVVNPSDGPGPSYNSTFASGIGQMQSAGVTVLGYVPTTWGTRAIASVESDIANFDRWYGVDGIYLDEMYNHEYSGNGAFVPVYYSELTAYIRSLGMEKVFGNSGADIPYYFIGSVDTIGYFENGHAPQLSVLGGWHAQVGKGNFAFFAYNITSIDTSYLAAASDYVSYLYITDGVRPYPYSSLPSYFGQLVSDLGSMVPVTMGDSPAQRQPGEPRVPGDRHSA